MLEPNVGTSLKATASISRVPLAVLLTTTLTPADVVVLPAASRATAVSVWHHS
jgi:hypothetical protein